MEISKTVRPSGLWLSVKIFVGMQLLNMSVGIFPWKLVNVCRLIEDVTQTKWKYILAIVDQISEYEHFRNVIIKLLEKNNIHQHLFWKVFDWKNCITVIFLEMNVDLDIHNAEILYVDCCIINMGWNKWRRIWFLHERKLFSYSYRYCPK